MERESGLHSTLDLSEFDAGFFASLEQNMPKTDMATLATEALAGILTVQDDEGNVKSYEDIKRESEAFFENPLVAQDMYLLSSLAQQYGDFCGNHGLDAASDINQGIMGDIYRLGQDQHTSSDGHDHDKEKKRKRESKSNKKTGLSQSIGQIIFSFKLKSLSFFPPRKPVQK